MTQSNDLSQRVDHTEGQIVDLQLTANLILQAINKNSEDIAVLIEVSRQNSELGRQNSELGRQNSELGRQNSELGRQNSELGRQNSEGISALRDGTAALQLSQLRTEAALQVFQQHTDEAIQDIRNSIATLTASNERMEQLLEYVIRRDQGR